MELRGRKVSTANSEVKIARIDRKHSYGHQHGRSPVHSLTVRKHRRKVRSAERQASRLAVREF